MPATGDDSSTKFTGILIDISRRHCGGSSVPSAGLPGPNLGRRWPACLVATTAEDRLNISLWPGEIYGCLEFGSSKTC